MSSIISKIVAKKLDPAFLRDPAFLNLVTLGEWGEILFDFENGTAEIIRLAAWDTMKTKRFANKAIAYLLNCEHEKLPKEMMMVFEV